MLYLPNNIKRHLLNMECEKNSIGCSRAGVYKFTSKTEVLYLKVESKAGNLKREYKNLLWLQNRIPVPKIIEWASEEEFDYLLTSEVGGKMLCDDYYLKNPTLMVSLLADGIKLLKSVDIKDCPIDNGVHKKLKEAQKDIELKRIDMSDWEESTKERFSSPEELFNYLRTSIPKNEELVFAHGDYCLQNIFGNDRCITGFIDVGNSGVADLWQDVSLCIRCLWHSFNTTDYDESLLKEIGIPMDKEKLDYYILLDELT